MTSLYSSVLKSTIESIDNENNVATIKVDKIDVGMSGFVVQKFDEDHSSILNSAVVQSYDAQSGIATLKLSAYTDLENDALPKGNWKAKVGDVVILAFAYNKALLIAPTSDIYNRITKGARTIEWIHPDIFATMLSAEGHPTPLKSDFDNMSSSTYIGLIFLYLDKKLYTLDSKSFKILNVSDLVLEQTKVELPFYSRVEEIDASWFGEGSDELESYEPYYYELLVEFNQDDKVLKESFEKFKSEEVKEK